MSKINQLWSDIADFEEHEYKNDSTNPILANARRGARMQAYERLQDIAISSMRFVCLCGKRFDFQCLLEHQKSCEVITN